MRIYCLLSPSHHGSTLLSLLLGNHHRTFALGDTIPSGRLPRRCGCGQPFTECDFWKRVRAIHPRQNGVEFIPARPELLPWRTLNQFLTIVTGLGAIRLGTKIRFEPFGSASERYFEICRTQQDFDTFIDGYKSISRYVALKAAGFRVRGIIHLIRDPRAFAASSKRKGLPVLEAAHSWVNLHRNIDRVARWGRERIYNINYERLCVQPNAELEKLQKWLELPIQSLVRPVDPDVHWIGSASMRRFTGEIRLDEKWKQELTPEERLIVETLTTRLASTYGYHFT